MSTETILEVRAVLDAYFDGINGERYEDVAALFAPDGELLAPGVKPQRGREAIAGYFGLVLARYPVHHDQPTRTLIDGPTATVEIDFTGELASGAPLGFGAVDVFDLDAEGRIAKLVTWYDSHLVRSRLTDAEARDDARARTRAALREVRTGEALELSGSWTVAPAGPLAARATTETPKPGDVLLVHGDADLAALDLDGVAAVVASGTLTGATELPHGDGWDLGDARRGLFVSIGAGAALWT
jgi:SnoaL-like protein